MLPPNVVRLLERQFGVAARRQVVPRHLSRGQLDGYIRRGALVPVHRGVYRAAGAPLPPEAAAMAAALRCRSHAGLGLVTGPLVLTLFGVDGYAPDRSFEVLVPPRRRLEGLQDLPARHAFDTTAGRTRVGRLPVTDPARTLCELALHAARRESDAASSAHRRLRVAVHSASWRGVVDRDRLARCAERLGSRHAGARLLLDWDSRGWLRSGSGGETQLVEILRSFGLQVRQQVWVTEQDRVDVLLPTLLLVIEYDGEVDHDGDAADRDRDRDARLARRGYVVVRIRRSELADRVALRRRLTAVARERAATLGVVSPL